MTDNGEQREQEQPAPVEDIPADEFVYVRSTATGLVQPDPIPRRWLGTELGEGLEEADEGAVRATLDAGRSPTATGPVRMRRWLARTRTRVTRRVGRTRQLGHPVGGGSGPRRVTLRGRVVRRSRSLRIPPRTPGSSPV
jgi:hypothetical protein